MSDDQVWKVAVTPAQRFALVRLSHSEGQKLKGQRSRFFRRFNRAFGLVPILDQADAHAESKVNTKLVLDRTPSLFTVTAENVDYAVDLMMEVDRDPAVDRTLGSLFDVLDDLKAKRPYEEPMDVPAYDAATEDWTPEKAPKPARPVEEQIAAYLRAKGERKAAELVDQGGWDQEPDAEAPAAAPNGEAHPAS
jgi:hypothetical protein